MKCEFCNNSGSEHLKYKIREYKHWSIYLWKYPYYLGRCFIKLNRHAEDFFDIDEEEQKELFEITRDLRDAIEKSFDTDLFNYASLGNEIRHVHLHVIPRYSKDVIFEGIVFRDEKWGKNYAPYDKKFTVPNEILEKFSEKIKISLK